MKSYEVQMVRRPRDIPTADDFEIAEVKLPDIRDGQVLVENLYMSIEPYMRRCMNEDCEDQAPWPIRGSLNGPAVGRVIKTRNEKFREGDIVESLAGWRKHFVSDGSAFVPFDSSFQSLIVRSPDLADPKDYIGILGLASQAAYAGMIFASDASPGETVVISSGAGSVGSMACQIAKMRGLRVVASAGSDEKVAWLKNEIKVDDAFNYRFRPISESLRAACPDGIDLVLENASPEHLSACLPLMNLQKLILISGFISLYSTGGRAAPLPNFEYVLDRFLTIRTYTYMDYFDRYDRFAFDLLSWRSGGFIKFKEVFFDRLDLAPRALGSLLSGELSGKPIIQL